MGSPPLLKMESIHKSFGKVHAVKGVDMEIGHGEIVGLIGNNGAGKSTLIKVLVGVYPKTRGRIFWEGQPVEINSIADSRRLGIEAVYQEQAVVEQLSITKNVFMGREIVKSFGPFKFLDYKSMAEAIQPLMDRMGLNVPSLDHEVRFCSGGERQAVAIARAMYFKARLVILDEPTRNLSVAATKKVLSFILELKNQGISSIFITHNMDHVYSVADRLIIMSRGKKILDVAKDEKSKEEIERIVSTDGVKQPVSMGEF